MIMVHGEQLEGQEDEQLQQHRQEEPCSSPSSVARPEPRPRTRSKDVVHPLPSPSSSSSSSSSSWDDVNELTGSPKNESITPTRRISFHRDGSGFIMVEASVVEERFELPPRVWRPRQRQTSSSSPSSTSSNSSWRCGWCSSIICMISVINPQCCI